MKNVEIEEPTTFLDHVFLECTKRESEPNEKIIERWNKILKSCVTAGAGEKLPGLEKPRPQTAAWSYDMEGHARKSVERFCDLANKRTEQLYEVSSPCWDDHQIKTEEVENKGELAEVRSQIVF